MLRKILVPIDGSPLSERAIPLATALARAAEARLILLRCVESRAFDRPDEAGPDPASALDALTQRVSGEGVETEPYLYHLFYDDIGAVINGTAAKGGADLIVMSTHGRGGLGRWIYGSVADQVLREAEVPVLLVPPAGPECWPADRRPRILVPLDGSELAGAALGPATELAELLGAELHLLTAIEPATYAYAETYVYVDIDLTAERAEAEARLEQLAAPLRAAGRPVVAHATIGSPSSAIAATAAEVGADLIAMATHGRGGLVRMVLGSVATGTLQRAAVPILLVRPTGAAAETARPAPLAATDPVAAEELAGVPTVDLPLTARELDLLERGLSELMYSPGADYQISRPVRALLERLKQAESALVALDDTGAPPNGSRVRVP